MKPFSRLQASLIVSSIILAPYTFGQLLAEELSPVVVSATRSTQSLVTTPSSITIITSDDIENSGASNIAEVLNTQASIQLNDLFGNGSRVQVSMRGFADNAKSNVLILVDGRRLNNPDLAAPDLSGVALKDVKQIEIIHGSAGTLFGDQAVGGVINIITKTPEKYSAHAEVEIGSFNTKNLRGSISNKVDKLGYRLSVEKIDTDNYRQHNKQDYLNVLARVDYQLGKTNLFIDYQLIDEKLELAGGLTKAEMDADPKQVSSSAPFDFNDGTTDIKRLGINTALSSNWNLEMEYTDSNSDVKGKSFSSDFTQIRKHKGITPRIIGTIPVEHGAALITAGIDYNTYDYDFKIPAFFLDTVAEQKTKALYLQSVIPMYEKISLTLGGRRASFASDTIPGIALDDDVTVFEAGVSYQRTKDQRLFFRIDENFRFAKIDENTYTSPGVVGLETQTGKSIELGSEWKNATSSAKLVVYSLKLENEIDFDPTAADPFGTFFGANVNLDPTKRTGFIAESRIQYSSALNMGVQYNYIDSRFDGGAFDGKEIPFVAKHNLTINAQYKISSSWSTTAEARYTGERYQAGDYGNNVDKVPALTLLNAQIRYQQKDWSASLRINNLTNETYAGYVVYNGFSSGYYPAPERNVMAKIRYEF